jgi:hypothetical protein
VQDDEHLGEILNVVAYRHRAEGWGLSRKTGGRHVDSPVGPIAEDILQLPNGNHYDVLGGAEKGAPLRPGAGGNIGTINLRDRPWVAPVDHTPAWLLTGGGTGGGGTSPPPPVTPPPSDLGPLQRDLAALLNTLSSIQARLDGKASKDDIDTIYRLIAEQLIAVHVGELVERIDKLQQQQIEQKAILDRIAASRILRF